MIKAFLTTLAGMLFVTVSFAQEEPQDSPAFTRLGIMTIRNGNTEEGLKHLDKAIKLDPENSLAYFWRGRAMATLGNYSAAIQEFDRVIQLDPNEPTAFIERANAKKKMGDDFGAQQDMSQAFKLQPSLKDPPKDAKVAKGPEKKAEKNQKKEDKPKPAEPKLKEKGKELSLTDRMGKLLDLSEKELSAEQYYQQGMAYLNQEKRKQAAESLEKAMALDPQFSDLRPLLDSLKQDISAIQKELDFYNQAIPMDPRNQNSMVYNNRGWAKQRLGDWDGAFADFDKATKLDSKNGLPYNNRAWIHIMADNLKEAMVELNKAIAADPKLAKAYHNRGWVLYLQGEYAKAVPDIAKTIELYPRRNANLEAFYQDLKSRAKK